MIIQLQLSKKDQTELGYQNPAIELELEYLMGEDYQYDPKDKKLILETIRKDMRMPVGYLRNYDIQVFNEQQLHVFSR